MKKPMTRLFSRDGLQELELFLAEDTLLAFDFDGTLAPIVRDPERAALSANTLWLLNELSQHAPVALISGRKLVDLRARTPVNALTWIGNHGTEAWGSEHNLPQASVAVVAEWERQLLPALSLLPGVKLENKGFSLTLHYRGSKQPERQRKKILHLASALQPAARFVPGKCVVNLVLPGRPHKGNALTSLLAHQNFPRAIFVGDDDTDEDVFRLHDPRILSVRVGKAKNSAANAYLKSQAEMDSLLQLLVGRHLPA